ncbi:sulfite exporter TauE/SafE family protein [Pigmentiphaga aceris]|uniref:Probable membrane transporter protein n=1 Tax=Pigmentiphaga aceris TaxID=1940612 RepID=A0A5C0AX52_9BURK|nr:sulfite exporter TauE/SafE family protein [Pigmentiphaga aceris]QEI06999.1 sulfite exporter TauE/SafE family protein [Pigmentiphaga aceris]
MDTATLLLAALVFLLAGTVKGVVGLGLPTIAMGLLALGMPPATAAALLLVPSFVTNVWQIAPFKGIGVLLRRLAPLLIAASVGTIAGGLVFGAPAGTWASLALGITLVLYAVWGLAGRQFRVAEKHEAWTGVLVGLVTGVVTAATGVFVVPAVPYLQALGLSKNTLIQAMGISFTVSTLALAAMLSGTGSLSLPTILSSLLMLLPALLGVEIGKRIRHRMSPATFRLCFLLGLAALGSYMVYRAMG